MNEQCNPIVALGMYSSGTAVLAGCLRLLGFNLGRNLTADDEAVQSGAYSENRDVVLIHDILLRDLGCRWDMIGPLPQDWLQTKAAEAAREKIRNLIERDFTGKGPWALSDSRLCKLLPLWLDIFSEKGLAPGMVLMVRHPYEVAQSLHNRQGFDLLKSHVLWLTANRQALSGLCGYDHAILTFDRLLADPVSAMETLGHELKLEYPVSMAHATQELITFIRPELKHEHHSQAASDQKEKEDFAHYAWLYKQFDINRSRSLSAPGNEGNASETGSTAKPVEQLALFPLISRPFPAHCNPGDTSHATEMFDNLLSLIRSYEQAESDTEIKRQQLLLAADHQEPMLYARILLPTAKDDESLYPVGNQKKILLAPKEWQKISMDINDPLALRQHRLRLEPLNTKGMIRIQSLALINAATDQPLWTVPGSAGFDQCTIEGQALVLDRREEIVMCATGTAPQVFLPVLPELPDAPLRFEVWLKADRDLTPITSLLTAKEKIIQKLAQDIETSHKQLDELQHKHEKSQSDWENTREQLQEIVRENDSLLQKWRGQKQELKEKLSEKDKIIQDLEEKEEQKQQVSLELEQKVREVNDRVRQIQELQDQLARQEELARQYFAELSKLEEEIQKKEEDKQQRVREAKEKSREVQRLQDQLARQEELTREYFTELSKAESQLVSVQDRAAMAESRNRGIAKSISQLRKDHQALVSSARWRWGNRLVRLVEILMLRKKQPLAVDHMQEVFSRFDRVGQEQSQTPDFFAPRPHKPCGAFYNEPDFKVLNSWLRQLNKDYELFRGSLRWKTGNAIIRAMEILTFRRKPALAVDHLGQIFEEYKEQSADYPVQNIKKLQSWLRQAKKDFSAIKNSMRWRTGDRIFSTIDTLLFRRQKPTAMDHALKITAEYENWEKRG